MEVSLIIQEEIEEEIIEAFAIEGRYPEIVGDGFGNEIPNPQTKEEFLIEMLQAYPRNILEAYFSKKAEVDRLAYIETAKIMAESITAEKRAVVPK